MTSTSLSTSLVPPCTLAHAPSRPSYTTGITALPQEIILVILSEARGGRNPRAGYLSYMLTCRLFLGPARTLLHSQVLLTTYDQAAGFLQVISSDSSLPASTKRLTLIYGEENSSPSREQATAILRLCYNIRDLTLLYQMVGEDDSTLWRRSVAPSAPGGRAGLEMLQSLKTSKIRVNRLKKLVQSSPRIHHLEVKGLYERDGGSEGSAEAPDSDDDGALEEDQASGQTQADMQPEATGYDSSPFSASGTLGDERAHSSPPQPDSAPSSVNPAPCRPLSALSLPLRSLTLDSANITDRTTLQICEGVSSTLTTLRLIHSSTLSRQGLLDVLSILPNLLTFELSGKLPPFHSGDPEDQLAPLDQLPDLLQFLQWLKIECDSAVSTEILSKLAKLPLSCLTIGFASPRLDPSSAIQMLERIPSGRLDSLFIESGMKWSASQLDEVRKVCDSVGTMFAGEPYTPPPRFS